MSEESCANCRFSRHETCGQEPKELECRRRPPVAPIAIRGTFLVGRIADLPTKEIRIGDETLEMADTSYTLEPELATWYADCEGGDVHRVGEWPIVQKEDWCGEWAPTPTAAPK